MYNLLPLTMLHADAALQFVCREFVSNSSLHIATNVPLDVYTTYLKEPFFAAIKAKTSFMFVHHDTGSIAGCILAQDILSTTSNSIATPESVKPIKALLDALEAPYFERRNVTEGTTLLVDIAVVSPTARRHGLYTKLRNAVHIQGSKLGYSKVIGELSSAATQHLCINKLGHSIISEIELNTFLFKNQYPFKTIETPRTIQLVEGNI